MIDEQVLERALRAEADTYPVPADGPAGILDVVEVYAPERRVRHRVLLGVAAAVVVLAVGIPVASRVGGGASPSAREFLTGEYKSRVLTSNSESGATGGGATGGGATVGDVGEAGELTATVMSGQAVADGVKGVKAVDGAKVVRTGEVAVEVGRDRVAPALREASALARAHHGYVSDSTQSTSGDSPSGSVTLRVPVAEFDRTVDEASRLGEVRSSNTNGTDVTDQVTDTAARLKSLTATRAQLQALLARAKDVGEVLAVQARMTEVQTQIEQLQAKQDALADSTTYGTLRVSVSVHGASEDPDRGGFAGAWDDAVDGFVGGLQGLVGASGTIAFVLLVLGALAVLLRLGYRAYVRRTV